MFLPILGVFAAAHDDKMEWVIVKGVAGYGNVSQSSGDDWMSFGSIMAASLVANILRDADIFQDWSHYDPGKSEHSALSQFIPKSGDL